MKHGTNIEKLLEIKGWTQNDLSNRTNLTPAAISQIINGQRDPSLSSIIKLAYALEVKIDDLINSDFKKLREFTFEAYLGEEGVEPRRNALSQILNTSASQFWPDKNILENNLYNKISKWLINIKELELPHG